MNLVVACIAAVLLLVFAYLAADRRRKLLLWHRYAGLAVLFAVVLAGSFFIPDFFPPPEVPPVVPPANGNGEAAENVVVEGSLKVAVAECAGGWCFSIDVMKVISGPEEIAAGMALEVRTGKRVLLRADRLVRVSGMLQNGSVEAKHTDIFLVDSLGRAVAVQVVEEEQPKPAPEEFGVVLVGEPVGDWEQCDGAWCVEVAVLQIKPAEFEVPEVVVLRSVKQEVLGMQMAVVGTYKNGVVEVKEVVAGYEEWVA